MRPGTKVRFWTPRFKNKPDVEPPGLLRLASALSICSVVGFLVYSVAMVVATPGTSFEPATAAYVVLVHFLLPLGISYSVATNSLLSQYLLLAYIVILSVATMAGWGYFGELRIAAAVRAAVSTSIFLLLFWWLFRNDRMRYYYALIADRPVPDDLRSRSAELAGRNWLSPRTKAVLEWFADNLELAVMLGFIVVVIYAFMSTYWT